MNVCIFNLNDMHAFGFDAFDLWNSKAKATNILFDHDIPGSGRCVSPENWFKKAFYRHSTATNILEEGGFQKWGYP